MKLFCHGDDVPDRPCCSLDSVNDARRICEQLGVPHYVLNLESAFGRDVVRRLRRASTRAGARRFPACAATRSRSSATCCARPTRSTRAGSPPATTRACVDGELHRGLDPAKDQSYFLWGIDRARAVAHAPAGGRADEAGDARRRARAGARADRREAREPGHLLRARRRPHEDHRAPARRRRAGARRAARSCGATARVVGEHEGFARFTVGQRRGLPGGFAEPMFVVEIRARDARGGDRPARRAARPRRRGARGELARRRRPTVGRRASRCRSGIARAPARGVLVRVDDDEIELALDEPVSAITPGQSLVLYDGERVLGGGVIERARRERCR